MAKKQEEINTKNEDAYLKAIRSKFEKERYKSLHHFLANPTNGSIRDKILSMLRKGENLDFENALKGFLNAHKVTKREELIDKADKSVEQYRSIQRLLKGDTKNGNNNYELLKLTAYLVELEQENSLDKENAEAKQTSNSKNINTIGLFGIITIALVSLVIIFSLSNKKDESTTKNPESTVTINAENFIVSDINKIIPNQNTEFFDKNNEPQIWYASYNNQKEFYNTNGFHPITNRQLQPVTKEVIKTIFVEKEIITPEKTPIKTGNEVQQPIATEASSLLNTSIINTKNNKEISLFIFDTSNKIDNAFSNHLKQELKNKKYKVTPDLILSSKLNSEIIEHLQSGDVNYFDNKIQNHTDYICIGNINYFYSQNTIQKNRTTCKMQVDYSIISSKTGEIIDSYSNLINGNGLSKINAKNNTIKKFSL